MNEELLNILREIADPANCKLPDGWKTKTRLWCPAPEALEISLRDAENHVKVWVVLSLKVNDVIDLLGRLMRAIEGEGKPRFNREDFYGDGGWIVENGEGLYVNEEFQYGDVASEALALARCIRAACAVDVAT